MDARLASYGGGGAVGGGLMGYGLYANDGKDGRAGVYPVHQQHSYLASHGPSAMVHHAQFQQHQGQWGGYGAQMNGGPQHLQHQGVMYIGATYNAPTVGMSGGFSNSNHKGNNGSNNNALITKQGGWGGRHNRRPGNSQTSEAYEVHDNQFKAPISVNPIDIVITSGGERLLSQPPRPIAYGSRNIFRVCEAFQDGYCASGDRCHDVHVHPDYLSATRSQLASWLTSRENDFLQARTHTPQVTFRVFVADLKEIVEVPASALSFTKGLYVDPTTRAKRTRGFTHQGGQNAPVAAQVPTSCGLYASDPTQCKWGRWCNQVHIDAAWMATKKAEFESWFTALESRFTQLPEDHPFVVHDPQLKVIVKVPKYAITNFSRGLFQGSAKKAPSVCLLYQRGRCTAGACCNQIHVAPEYLNYARNITELESNPTAAAAKELAAMRHEMETYCAALQAEKRQEVSAEQATVCHIDPMSTGATNDAPPALAGGVAIPPYDFMAGTNESLIEHIEVDDEMMEDDATRMCAFNASAASMHSTNVLQVNKDGSYSNNPYGSVTSLPDAQTSIYSNYMTTGGIAIGGVGGTVEHRRRNVANASYSFPRTPAASIVKPRQIRLVAHLPQYDDSLVFNTTHSGVDLNAGSSTAMEHRNQQSNQSNYVNNGNEGAEHSHLQGAQGQRVHSPTQRLRNSGSGFPRSPEGDASINSMSFQQLHFDTSNTSVPRNNASSSHHQRVNTHQSPPIMRKSATALTPQDNQPEQQSSVPSNNASATARPDE